MSSEPTETERAAAAYAAAQDARETAAQADTQARINGNEQAGSR